MKNIFARTTNELFSIVSEKEKEMSPAKELILYSNKKIWRLEDFNEKNYPKGRFYLENQGIRFPCFFNHNVNKKLYVMFSGGRLSTDEPVFNRWSYYTFADGCVLCIDDPMYERYKNLLLGWYYGTEEFSYRKILANIVNEIANIFEIERNNIIFYSSSGGGNAALDCVCQLDGSNAIVINPQVCLSLYPTAKHFQTVTNINLKKRDKYDRNDITYKLKKTTSKIVFMVNIASKDDQIQLDYLLKVLKLQQVEYGISQLSENIFLWTYNADVPDAHGAQDWRSIFFCLTNLLNCKSIDDVKDLYMLFNDFITDRFQQVNKRETYCNSLKEFYLFPYEQVKYNERIVIYGAGFVGKSYVRQIKYNRYCQIVMWCDKKESTRIKDGIQVDTPDNIVLYKFDKILISIYDDKVVKSVMEYLQGMGIQKNKIIYTSHNRVTDF